MRSGASRWTLAVLAGALAGAGPARPPRAAVMGINEALSVPRAFVDKGRLDPEAQSRELAADARFTVGLGAAFVRANSATYPFVDHHSFAARGGDWDMSDRWVRAVQDAQLEALMVIGPWPGNRTAAFTAAYVPTDMVAYTTYVTALVERYDFDGVDDMPGLTRAVRHWEIDNEPDLHNSAPPRGGSLASDPEQFETPAQYARVLVASSAAVKRADPTAVVLSGGVFRPHHATGRAYLKAVLDEPGARAAIDALSLHCYFDDDGLRTIDRTMAAARDLAPGVPVWITETGVPADGRRSWADERWQGRMVAATYGAFLAAGAKHVFWHTLADPPSGPGTRGKKRPFATHSLLRTDAGGRSRSDKPAGAVYRRLAAHLADYDPATSKELRVDGGRLLWTGSGWLAYWGTPTLPPGSGAIQDLLSGDPVDPNVSAVRAPAWISPASPAR